MDLRAVKSLARQLMNLHGLQAWEFAFDHAFRRFGCCHYRKQKITLSRRLASLNNENQVKDTILHEIAHAITFLKDNQRGHGRHWRARCREVGCNPQRCYNSDTVAAPKSKWSLVCPKCGHTVTRHRIRKKLACSRCCNTYSGGKWDARFVFVKTPNR